MGFGAASSAATPSRCDDRTRSAAMVFTFCRRASVEVSATFNGLREKSEDAKRGVLCLIFKSGKGYHGFTVQSLVPMIIDLPARVRLTAMCQLARQ
jgi:hypothetical protein